MNKSAHMIYTTIILLIVAFIIILLARSRSGGSIVFDPKNLGLNINIDEEQSFSEILKAILRNQDRKSEALSLMRDSNIYSIEDMSLYAKLEELDEDSDEGKRFITSLKNRSSLLRKHGFHEISDAADGLNLIEAIENITPDCKISRRIRQLQKSSRGPWKRTLKEARIYIEKRKKDNKPNHGIERGKAVIYCGDQLELISNEFSIFKDTNTIESSAILVTVEKNQNVCPDSILSIKLNIEDAEKLYENTLTEHKNIAYFQQEPDLGRPYIPEKKVLSYR